MGFEPEGEGPHAWLQIRKIDTNTRWLAGALARLAGVARRDVGLRAERSRRRHHPVVQRSHGGRAEPDWGAILSDQVALLRVTRHRKKLRRGVLQGNRFRIRVQGFEGDRQALESRVRELGAGGVPNYFGEQRFGRDSGNVAGAWEMLVQGKAASRSGSAAGFTCRRPARCCSIACSPAGFTMAAGVAGFPGRR